jgi:hypothetical protein
MKNQKHKLDIKSVPAPTVSMEELVEIAECAQICSKYKEYNLGDSYIGDK